MYSAGRTYLEGENLDGVEVSFTCTTIDHDSHIRRLQIHNDEEEELRNNLLVWLNASPERQKSFINEDDLKSEEPIDPLRYVFADVTQALMLAEAANDLEDYRLMKKLLKVLKKAYPETAEDFANGT